VNTTDFYNQTPELPVESHVSALCSAEDDPVSNDLPEYPISNPVLESMLEDICIKGSYIIEPLSTHVCALQEMFLDALYEKIGETGIELTEKVTIYQDMRGELKVLGKHPEKEKIEKTLAKNPTLAEMFTTLSSHSEIARDIVNINRIFASMDDNERLSHDGDNGYHLSMKGGMSHFYFI